MGKARGYELRRQIALALSRQNSIECFEKGWHHLRVSLTRPTAAADSSEEVIMNVPLTESIRNVAVVSHAGSGKTSLVEALAYCAGSLSAPGSIFAGTTVSDFEPEEIHRRTSLNTTVLRCSYQDQCSRFWIPQARPASSVRRDRHCVRQTVWYWS